MITVALDEYGTFENVEEKNKCMVIGGIIFKCSTDSDRIKELERLKKLYEHACTQVNCEYPTDLHYNRRCGRIINLYEANAVKDMLMDMLPDFLQGKGEWINDKPHGRYIMYALVGDKKGLSNFSAEGISNLIDDNVATNRYEHMAYRTIENILFYNLHNNDNDVRLELASRSLPDNEEDLLNEMKKLGADKLQTNSNSDMAFYAVTNGGSYRSALASAIQNSKKQNMNVDLRVQSINYRVGNHNLYQGFLYMADTICSVYCEAIHNIKTLPIAMEKLYNICSKYIGAENTYLWAYDEIDQQYREAVRSYESGMYFECIENIFKIKSNKSAVAGKYDSWISILENRLINNANYESFRIAVDRYNNYIRLSNDTSVALNHTSYAYDLLIKIADKINCDKILTADWFKLYMIKLIMSNHLGDFLESDKAYNKCIEYSQYVSTEEYLDLRNMMSVYLADSGEFDKALKNTLTTVSYEEMLVDIKKEICPVNDQIFVHYGCTLSQLGQCLSFSGKYDEALVAFQKSLSVFGEDIKNVNRTTSYYLHALIEANNIVEYDNVASGYFGAIGYEKQFRNIIDNGNLDDTARAYALYVYLKGLYRLHINDISRVFSITMINDIKKISTELDNCHPWEMIYKYCVLILFAKKKSSDNKIFNEFKEKALSCINEPKGIMLSIIENNSKEIHSVIDNIECRSSLSYMYR